MRWLISWSPWASFLITTINGKAMWGSSRFHSLTTLVQYLLPPAQIMEYYSISYQIYANDMQLYYDYSHDECIKQSLLLSRWARISSSSVLKRLNQPITTLKTRSFCQSWTKKSFSCIYFSRLDYCNGVFTGLNNKKKNYQVAAAHPKCWLLESKTKPGKLTISYKSLNHCTVSLCVKGLILKSCYWSTRHWMFSGQNTSQRCLLSSSGTGLLSVPMVRIKQGKGAFIVYALCLWKKNPPCI